RYYSQLKDHGSKVAIGVFHAYGHSMERQIYNNPRYIDNFGLVDGEQYHIILTLRNKYPIKPADMERLWSTIGNLVRMTRQMTAERRLQRVPVNFISINFHTSLTSLKIKECSWWH
ncbi:hypothetical protein INT45_005229, partial [Circinella minor]